jgi:hypothetical protein
MALQGKVGLGSGSEDKKANRKRSNNDILHILSGADSGGVKGVSKS